MTRITNHLDDLKLRIGKAAEAAGRDVTEITIMAVSKRQSVDAIHEAVKSGLTVFGENYVQEALEKIATADPAIDWHFIGQLQSNKTRAVAEHFSWVHTVSSQKTAERLSRQRPAHLPPLNVCIQICTDPETTHAGCPANEAESLCQLIAKLPGLKLRGLMTLPLVFNEIEAQRQPYRELRELYENLNRQGFELDTLSMGMSNDLEAAVVEGSTMVRVGTALFGARTEN